LVFVSTIIILVTVVYEKLSKKHIDILLFSILFLNTEPTNLK